MEVLVYFSPALRRAAIIRSSNVRSFRGFVCLTTSKENLGLIRKTSAASARASSSRPNLLYLTAR